MRTATLAVAMAILCATGAQAQKKMGTDMATTKNHGCMMMSDSTSKVLGLTADQFTQVKASDDRCMKACEKTGEAKTGKMDHTAMTTHDGEMKKILTADQYAKWNSMCNMSKADSAPKRRSTY